MEILISSQRYVPDHWLWYGNYAKDLHVQWWKIFTTHTQRWHNWITNMPQNSAENLLLLIPRQRKSNYCQGDLHSELVIKYTNLYSDTFPISVIILALIGSLLVLVHCTGHQSGDSKLSFSVNGRFRKCAKYDIKHLW